MSFKSLNLKASYNSLRDDLIQDFYNPVLSEAVKYFRTTGFFNSKSLVLAAKGLKNFIKNNGKMKLLCGTQLSKEDLDTIVNAEEIANKLSDDFLEELLNIQDEIELNHLKLLAWLISNDFLEIKIGIVKNEEGYVGGILHEKTGILLDEEGNQILFSGSNNETFYGWSSKGRGNVEKFKVFVSWEDSKFMEDDVLNFKEDWDNNNIYLEVVDIPLASKKGLIKLAPKNIDEVLNLKLESKEIENNGKLRDYQVQAIRNWVENGRRGIFEMATGTGKTFTALNCIKDVLNDKSGLFTVIACPYAHLSEQWVSNIKNFFDIPCYNIYGTINHNWKKDLHNLIFKFNLGVIKEAIVVTTHKTFSSNFFIKEINNLNVNSLLVVDETHHVVSKSFSEGLLESYNFRLGLSATLNDEDERMGILRSYFEGVVFSYSLSEALYSYDVNGNSYLAHYYYCPIKVQLNNSELNEYYELSSKISKLSYANKENQSEYYKTLLFKRSNILKNAKSKYDCLRKLLRTFEDHDHLIVFCSPQQINNVLKILKEEGIKSHKFTQNEGTRKSDRFGGLSEREYLISKFDEGVYKALVAIKCLDEGVDVPSASKVILMSSSKNPTEYIQRRGRVLRQYEGKKKALIYDMAVVQYDNYGEVIYEITQLEKDRMLDFIGDSDNQGYSINLLSKWGVL